MREMSGLKKRIINEINELRKNKSIREVFKLLSENSWNATKSDKTGKRAVEIDQLDLEEEE